MGARTDFWLYVHELNLCLEGEGVTTDEQHTNVLDSLMSLPRMARLEVTRELNTLVGELTALSAEVKMMNRVADL